ncbi:MAG: ParA family protein [Bacteroidota bacterium]
MGSNTRIISVANSKGGVGKSVITIMLAVTLAKKKNKRVLILDCDNQGSISEMYEREKEQRGGEVEALVEVEELTPRRVQTFLKRFGDDYDVIFIDVPRMTDAKKDTATVLLLNNCDSILVPVIGSEVDVLSTMEFMNIIDDAAIYKKEMEMDFRCYGFINRRNLRKSNEEAEKAMKKRKLKMFKNSLSDLKIFTTPSFYQSILDTAEGERRFMDFYKEFVRKFKL